MPDCYKVFEWLSDTYFQNVFSTFRIKEWEGKTTDSEQYIDLEDETINQEYADFFGVEVLEGSMLDEKDGKNMVVINEAAVKAFGWTQPVGKKIDKLGSII